MSLNLQNLRPPWKKGECPNPGGRPGIIREFRRHIDKLTNHSLALAELLWAKASDEHEHPALRAKCIELLMHYRFGPPLVPEEGLRVLPPDLTPAEFRMLEYLRGRLLGRTGPGEIPGPGGNGGGNPPVGSPGLLPPLPDASSAGVPESPLW